VKVCTKCKREKENTEFSCGWRVCKACKRLYHNTRYAQRHNSSKRGQELDEDVIAKADQLWIVR